MSIQKVWRSGQSSHSCLCRRQREQSWTVYSTFLVRAYAHVCVCMCVHTHKYTHTHAQTHIHTHSLSLSHTQTLSLFFTCPVNVTVITKMLAKFTVCSYIFNCQMPEKKKQCEMISNSSTKCRMCVTILNWALPMNKLNSYTRRYACFTSNKELAMQAIIREEEDCNNEINVCHTCLSHF